MSQKQKPQPQVLFPAAIEVKFQRGVALHQHGRLAAAERIYQEIVQQEPTHFDALHLLGFIALQTHQTERAVEVFTRAIALNPDVAAAHSNLGSALIALSRFEEAVASYERAITLKPNYATAYNNRGNALNALMRHEEALASYDKAVALNPDYVEAVYNRGILLNKLKRHDEALASCDNVIALKPDYSEAYNIRGNALNALQRHEEALASYDKAIVLKPEYAEAHNNRGNVLSTLQRHEEALASYDKAVALKPDLAEAHYSRAAALNCLKRHEEALAGYDKAIALKPDFVEAYNDRGNLLSDLMRFEEALLSNDKAIASKPDFADAYNNRGVTLNGLRRPEEALASYDKAIALKSDFAEAYNNRAVALNALKRAKEALASCDKAIALKPDYADAHCNRGAALNELKRHADSASAYADALRINPQHPFTKGMFLHQKMLSCDWRGVDKLIAEVDDDVASGKLSAEPFGWQGAAKLQRSQQLAAELFNRQKFPAANGASTRQSSVNHQKIRVGYLSGELREQATSHLIVGVLELHDHSRFEIYGFDNGWDDKSDIRRRIDTSVHRMIDISHLSDSSAAAAIRENQINILVNLNGYFGEHRTGVFAQKPAPIQVNYLGFPGTLGAGYMDYIIADEHVLPPSHKEFYTEKVVYLPDCYQANDRKKEIGTHQFSRAECGLPQSGFVFCCFNNNYKITPEVFDCWMRILNRADGSVLWLLEDNASAASNLMKEAAARSVNPGRLVFAKRMSLPDHLARHRLADLFLDTLPSNAHTTASDALWAGLPILTRIGETFAGRVAASLLNAIGCRELITSTPQAYEDLAIQLATNPKKLAAIKHKLARNRLATPLFDTELFTRHIEAAYAAMYDRNQAGLPPDHIAVPNLSMAVQ